MIYLAKGGKKRVEPADSKEFSLDELQEYVGGSIQMITFPSGKVLVCNENGKLENLAYNGLASEVWHQEFPIEEYPENNADFVVGDCIITSPELVGM